ncbi:hypothetical protein BGZ72_001967 [Mortierella alpina]|nr:hypothetical protein BGZ72_001967 [Mortierella alpina]
MNFDDSDAPPIPAIPTHSSQSTVDQDTASISSNIIYAPSSMPTPTDTPELPPASSKSTAGLGPLDLPQSSDHEQPRSPTEPAGKPIPIPKSSSRADLDMELDEELSRSVSTVESWLKRTNSDMEASALASTPLTTPSSASVNIEDHAALNSRTSASSTTFMAETTPAMSSSSTAASHITSGATESPTVLDLRRPSHTSTISTNDEDNNSDSEDIKVPITVLTMGSNRLSRMYETQSIQMAHSHTDELDAQGGSAMLSATTTTAAIKPTRNSIRFSQYGLLLSKDMPLASQSGSSAFGYSRPDKPLPRRPVSLFMSSSSLASTLTETSESATTESGADGEPGLGHSNQHLTVSSPHHGGLGTRPATICISSEMSSIAVTTTPLSSVSAAPPVSPVTVTIRPLSSLVSSAPLNTPAVSLTPAPSPSPPPPQTETFEATAPQQDETMEFLAFKTAKRCWAEDNTFLKRDEISQYLGAGSKPFNRLVLSFYMRHFNFSGKRLDTAFRLLCQKLMLRGETQEVDRVLEQFAARFVECNPESIFGHKDVVHAITYSILLLNTDLHVVKQSNANKMSRSAFVKNTLQVVLAQTEYREEHERQSEDSSTHGLSLSRTGTGELSVHGSGSGGGKRRTPSVKSWKSAASHQSKSSKMGLDPKANGGHGNGKWWIQELEQLLKDIYSTVKHHQILLPLTPRVNSNSASAPTTPTVGGFPNSSPQNSGRAGPMNSAGAARGYKPAPSNALIDVGFGGLGSGSGAFAGGGGGSSASSVSGGSAGAPGSGENNSGSGSTLGSVLGLGRRNSTNARTRQLRQDAMDRLRAQETGSGAAEDDSGIRYGLAPSISVHDSAKASSMHGAMSSLPPIHTPSSSSSSTHHSNSFTSTPPSPASSIISQRDGIASRRGGPPGQQHHQQQKHNFHGKSGSSSSSSNNPRLRKEGILYRKHLLERADKKASNRSWRQLLVVLDRGGLSLFRADGQLGQAIEEQGILFDEIRLQHTITNVLPPPGYSSSRRHVFAIQLFTGAVYLFQAANAVDCEEWAKTCNYWAARTTKEPLPGGVINMDYGWGRSLDMFLQQQQQQQQQQDSVLTGNNNSNQSVMMLSGNSSGSSLAALATPTAMSSSSNISLEDSNDDAKSVNNSMNAGTSFLNHPPPTSGGSLNGSGSIYGNSGIGSGRAASVKSTSSRHHHHFGSGGTGASNVPLGDRVVLFEWSVPLPTMSMSVLTEEEQCEALKKYVAGLESDMETHQEHRVPMMKLFLPKSNNYIKAFNNWERRSRHLLKEMVKYQIYVESLEKSMTLEREQKLKEDVAAEPLETALQHLEVEDDDEEEEKHEGHIVQEAC